MEAELTGLMNTTAQSMTNKNNRCYGEGDATV